MRKRTAIYFLSILFFLPSPSLAQSPQTFADTVLINRSISHARLQFSKAMGADGALYNGTSLEKYWYGIKGTPYYKEEEFVTGNIYFDGTLYENVLLNYDMMRDQVIVKSISKNLPFIAINERISGFSLHDKSFVRMDRAETANSLPVTGFYEKLHDGSLMIIARKQKKVDDVISMGEHSKRFIEFNDYFMGRDGIFHHIRGQKDVLDLFADKKKEIRQLISNHKLSWKKNPELLLVQTAVYYDNLKKNP